MKGEVIFMRLTDVGRKINLQNTSKIFPGIHDKKKFKTKDTPSYLDFPESLTLDLQLKLDTESVCINNIDLQIKLYEDGVISLIARLKFTNVPINELHNLRRIKFSIQEKEYNINQYLRYQNEELFFQIKDYIEEPEFGLHEFEHEKYTLYCINDENNPTEVVEKNKKYLACLLLGEDPNINLHKTQIEETLGSPFSFLKNDLAIFDFDRGIILDPNRDYEDILLVVEIANYQLLGLRVLDKFLERRLNIAEEDIHMIYSTGSIMLRRLNKKVGKLMRIKYDLTFILDNIENVSKLIGKYFLAQIYKNLSELFQLKQWSDSIRHRLETIGDIYNIAQTHKNEGYLLYLEILLTFIFIMEFFFIIFDFFKPQ
ncbi:MAG: hypothetical protein KGD73_06730 [Candidatus Lokiarchaeota archaeon]|nr:hypothetical protein [Candidatus Lokiarchaeota archaeon]